MTDRTNRHDHPTRRDTLAYGSAVVSAGLITGCTADVDSESDSTEPSSQSAAEQLSADAYPVLDRWLGTTEVGGVDDTYDGTIANLREFDNPRITVGAEGNGGPVAFDPSAVLVSPGSVVEWVWTAHGHHNVVADPESQLGVSDQSFHSGDAVERENTLHTEQFEERGTVLYHCEPHLGLGMKGALVVDRGP